jgi:hypothetical protein
VQLDVLLGVHQHGPVEVTQVAAGPRLRDQHAEGRQHLLFDAFAVLGGELELLERIAQPRSHPDRVQQCVLAVPRSQLRLARYSYQAVVECHGCLRRVFAIVRISF